jgi:hypothetical protein
MIELSGRVARIGQRGNYYVVLVGQTQDQTSCWNVCKDNRSVNMDLIY